MPNGKGVGTHEDVRDCCEDLLKDLGNGVPIINQSDPACTATVFGEVVGYNVSNSVALTAV